MGMLHALLVAASLAAGELILDSRATGYRWEDEWDFVTQTGAQTGNNELQDYVPEQVRADASGLSLVLNLQNEK